MVYKTALTANLNHWMYSPLQELTKVAAKKYPHLKFNFNSRASAAAIGKLALLSKDMHLFTCYLIIHFIRPLHDIGQDISSALEKATKRGLYNLLPMLLVFGADAASVMEALRISIRHGDDTALSLLLMSVVDPASSGTHSAPHLMHIRTSLLEKLPELIELAESLRFPHVLMRLHRIRQLFSSTGPDEGAAALSNLKSLERFNDYAPSEYVSSACGVTQRRDGSESGAGVSSSSSLLAGDGNTHGSRGLATAASGYDPFQIVDVFHQADAVSEVGADEEGETYELRSGPAGYRRCVVDRVDMSNITAELFFEKYVRLNQPVVLTATGAGDGGAGAVGASSTSTAAAVTGAAVAEGWDLSALLDRFGDIKEVAGDIPYATLFGHTEVSNCSQELLFCVCVAFLIVIIPIFGCCRK